MTEMFLGRQVSDPLAPSGASEPELAGLLHDLGHQLMTVSLLADSLQTEQALPAEARRQAELIGQETERAMGMVADHRPPVRSATPADPQLIDVRELASQVTGLARLAFVATVRLQPGPPAWVQVNPRLSWRILWNLIENAAKAAGPDGTVEVSISRGDGTTVEISDNGPGYGNAPPGTTGLGLSVVQQLLAATGGQLSITSAPEGGTVVRATFGGQADRIVLPRPRRAGAAIV
jgi:signal transduction histidine kinase